VDVISNSGEECVQVALEQIEESPELVILLRDAVNFYISHVEVRKTESKDAISDLNEISEQADQMTKRRDLARQELNALREQKHKTEADFDEQRPYLNLVEKIKNTEAEINERRKQLRIKEEEAAKKKQAADRQPGNKRLADDAKRAAAFLHGEKVGEEFIIKRLAENLDSFNKRLGDAQIDPARLQDQAKDIRVRTEKLTETILAKERVVANMSNFLRTNLSELDRLEELKYEFEKCETDYDHLVKLIKILSEVQADGTIILSTEKAVSA